MDQLIGADTVNTVPPATLNAFLDHGAVADTLGENAAEAWAQLAQLAQLAALDIDLASVTQKLQDEGVAAFAGSFDVLLQSIVEKQQKLQVKRQHQPAQADERPAIVSADRPNAEAVGAPARRMIATVQPGS